MMQHNPICCIIQHMVLEGLTRPSRLGSFTSRFMRAAARRPGSWSAFASTVRATSRRGWVELSRRCAKELESRLQYSSEIRKHVLEVTHPMHNSKRIVNTDNFYTSVALLMSLKEVGLYGRGTVRENSKHFPKAHMFGKKDVEARGTMTQGVSASSQIVAASWMDGNAVNIISNADASDQTEVRRLVRRTVQTFPAPRCIAEYNQHMQGVDRMDQLRAQFSLADGHSFQKWHKKLAMAFIDIARCNAYVTRRMVLGEQSAVRNPHRDFVIELASELISGRWSQWSEDEGMLYDRPDLGNTTTLPVTPVRPSTAVTPGSPACNFTLSKIQFPQATRGKRGCRVCLFEGRYETEKTNYCITHNVCLCSGVYPVNERFVGVVCPHPDWSCWRKYHEFYLPNGLFNNQGRIKRSSALHKAKRRLAMYEEADALASTPALAPVTRDDGDEDMFVGDEEHIVHAREHAAEGSTTSHEWYPITPPFSFPSISPSVRRIFFGSDSYRV